MTALADTCGSTIPGSGVTAHHVEAAHAKNSWAEVRAISVTKPVPGKAIRQLLDQCAQRQTHDLLLMVEGRSAEALEASAKGFSHRALDLIVRLQADCPPNERQKPLPRQ